MEFSSNIAIKYQEVLNKVFINESQYTFNSSFLLLLLGSYFIQKYLREICKRLNSSYTKVKGLKSFFYWYCKNRTSDIQIIIVNIAYSNLNWKVWRLLGKNFYMIAARQMKQMDIICELKNRVIRVGLTLTKPKSRMNLDLWNYT